HDANDSSGKWLKYIGKWKLGVGVARSRYRYRAPSLADVRLVPDIAREPHNALGIAQEGGAVKHVSLPMIRRSIVLLALVYAGCKGHKSCAAGSVAVPSDDPDGGVVCVAEPDDGGGGDGSAHDGPISDGPRDANPPVDARVDARPDAGPFCGDFICNNGET